jgi:hypothetical protein
MMNSRADRRAGEQRCPRQNFFLLRVSSVTSARDILIRNEFERTHRAVRCPCGLTDAPFIIEPDRRASIAAGLPTLAFAAPYPAGEPTSTSARSAANAVPNPHECMTYTSV